MEIIKSADVMSSPNSTDRIFGLFPTLSGDAKTELERLGTEIRYCRGNRVFSEGEFADHLFILRDGRIKVSVTSREGKTVILRIAERGQILGLSAALTGTEHEASAEALEPCRMISIPVREFKRFLAKYPQAAMDATGWAIKEYRILLNDICRLTLPSTVAGRLASLLLDWLQGHSRSGNTKPKFILPLTHEEIAGMAGTSRETVSRTLQQFQRENVISIKGASLTILNPDALQQLAV